MRHVFDKRAIFCHSPPMGLFAEHLRQAIILQETSVRALAKEWRPNSPETARRILHKYLAGSVTPTISTRDELAEALDLSVEMLPLPGEEAADMMAALIGAINRIRELERQIEEDKVA